MTNIYAEPVSKLLQLGRPEDPWLEYPALGITREHVPELVRLVQDNELRLMPRPDGMREDEDLPQWYAQVHAWRALGQLHAAEALPALLGILHQIDDDEDDWLSSDAKTVFGMMGESAIPPLMDYLADEDNPMYARCAASSSLAEIGKVHPDARERSIQGIVPVLANYENNDEGLNGFLIGDLLELKAVEQIDLIKQAFQANAVDQFINGDLEDVQVELGLLEKRLTPARRGRLLQKTEPDGDSGVLKKPQMEQKKQKKKRGQEKKSRKKNRKRK